jgi:alkylation response protein AidB-like acyl-CoA dehydrogenase
VEGGYRVSGRKVFASQSTHGTAMSTMFTFDDPEQGRRVLNMAVPLSAEGVSVADNWDTLGMRGTASNDVVLEDVFVADDKVVANRPYGVVDPPLRVIVSIAMPIISAVYLGVAEAAYQAAVVAAAPKAGDVLVQRQLGLMAHRLQVASWALDRALDVVGDDPDPSMERFSAALCAKREIALAGAEVCDLAMEVAGGAAFFKGSVIERSYRDIRAAKFHPLTPEQTLVHAGRLALGLPVDEY